MIINEEIIKKAREYAVSEIYKYGTPAIGHLDFSEKKGLELAEKLKADKKIVQLGTILMDLKLGQAKKENRLSEHTKMSAEDSKKFLTQFGINIKLINKIVNCIEAHHGNIPFDSIEAEICANADCYRFIHPRGFFVYLTLLGKRHKNVDECLEQAEKKMDEKHNILSLDICKKELEGYYKTLKGYIKDARN